MKTLGIVLRDSREEFRCLTHFERQLLSSAEQVVVIYIERNRWLFLNDPHTMLESEKLVALGERLHRKAIIAHLGTVEMAIKEINGVAEVTKLVINGDEKYKVRKCLALLGVELVIFPGVEKKRRFWDLFVQPLEEYVFEELSIPVVRMPVAQKKHKCMGG
jgi:hypothetical protein